MYYVAVFLTLTGHSAKNHMKMSKHPRCLDVFISGEPKCLVYMYPFFGQSFVLSKDFGKQDKCILKISPERFRLCFTHILLY